METVTHFEIDVRITPREGLLDPQGKAVQSALHSLGFDGVEGARVGRVVRLRVAAADRDAAREAVDEMCRKLLANPVTEDYDIELRGAAEPAEARS